LVAGGGTVVADEAYLTESMMKPQVKQVEGYSLVMPSYQGQLEAAEVAALIEYIRTLRGARRDGIRPGGPVYEPINGR
jgi:cytochrome c oxidase subunit 2